MRTSLRWLGVLMIPVAAAVVCSACGDSPTGPELVPTTITRSGSMDGKWAAHEDFAPDGAGTATATVTWAAPYSGLVEVYVTSASCNVAQDAADNASGTCSNLARATDSSKPKVVTLGVTGATTYRVWIANYSALRDTYTLTLTYPVKAK